MQPTFSFALAGGPGVLVTVEQTADNKLRFTATVANAAMAADLRGLFFHIADESLLAGLAITQASSTVTALQIGANGISNLGNGVSMLGSAKPFDLGVSFGSASTIGADDIRSVSFTLEHAGHALDLGLLSAMPFGAVMSSVGPLGGARFTTVKAVGSAPSAIAPVAANDSQSTTEDTALHASVAGLITDPDSHAFSFSTVGTLPAGLTFNADGSYGYQPPPDFNGLVQFQYRANDGQANSNVATVNIQVTPVNDAPVAHFDRFDGVEDQQIIGNLGRSVTDAEGDALTYTLKEAPVSGSISFNPDGSFVYTPNPNFWGTDSLRYSVTDSHGASPFGWQIVALDVAPVNDAPVAIDYVGYGIEDMGTFRGGSRWGNDVDLDLLTVRTVGEAPAGLVIDAGGTIQWPVPPNFVGTLSFTFEVDDGHGGTDTGTGRIIIEARNDSPIANDDAVATAYQTPVSFDPKLNDSDEEGDSFIAWYFHQPQHGSLVVNVDNSFTYTPADGFFGSDSFAYFDADFSNYNQSNFGTVFITVGRPPNVAPVAHDDRFEFDNENPSFTISAPGLLANDSDLFPDELSIQSYTQPDHGSVTVSAQGGFTYLPESGFIGSTSFNYMLSDGELTDEATVTFVVYDASPAQNDSYTTHKNQALTVAAPGLLANDSDLENIIDYTQPAHGTVVVDAGGSFVYTPATNFVGIDSFSYTASGLFTDDATVSITVSASEDGLAVVQLMGVLEAMPVM